MLISYIFIFFFLVNMYTFPRMCSEIKTIFFYKPQFPFKIYMLCTFFFIKNLCGGAEAEVSYFFKEFEPHSSLLVPYF